MMSALQKRGSAMKRLLGWVLMGCMLLLPVWGQAADKLSALPKVFEVQVESVSEATANNDRFYYKEYLRTTNQQVNQELKQVVDQLDAQWRPHLQPDERKNGRRNNRLDVEVNYARTGHSWLSTLVVARLTEKRQQVACPFTTRTWDLQTGQRIELTDLFTPGSAAWGLLAQRVQSHLQSVFPGEPRDDAAIQALCTPQALSQAEFTLGGMELTLHYEARLLFPEKTGLMHVRFFYPEFAGMMTEAAARQTDNSHWKMVAITADDGPRHVNSVKSLNNFRQHGVRVTYFVVGKLFKEGLDILQREFDANHLIASHSFEHWSGYSMKKLESRVREAYRNDEVTLKVLGEGARFFRAPGGTYPPWVEAEIGMPIIQWSVDTYDFRGANELRILENIKNNVRDGDIILMHDTGERLNKAIPGFAEWLWQHGYMMVSIEELAMANGITMEPNVVYHRFANGDYSERRDSNTN